MRHKLSILVLAVGLFTSASWAGQPIEPRGVERDVASTLDPEGPQLDQRISPLSTGFQMAMGPIYDPHGLTAA